MGRIEQNMLQIKKMLASTTIKDLSSDNITAETLHDALIYLTDSNFKTGASRSKAELRRCIADTLLLLDGVDMQDRAEVQNNEEA